MNDTMVLIVGRNDAPGPHQAAREVFPDAQIASVRNVREAAQKAGMHRRQLLILIDPDEAEIGLAAQATDEDNLPRWAAVVVGRGSSDLLECVSPDENGAKLLGRVFRSALQQHELLRENLQLRGDLKTVARRIRHDLLSPVNCISITCELMKELLEENAASVEPQMGVIGHSLAEISRAIERVSDLLNASAEPPPMMELSMGDVVAGVLVQLETELQQNGVIVESPSNWPEVAGVAAWLESIWWNLLQNAVKHNESSAPIQLGWRPAGEWLRFWVANRGAVVPAEMEDQLFRRFDQLHLQPSAGLGLSLVQRLVSLQGGSCGYERMENNLSAFYFTLPARTA
jgi:signal transduction histidine kinase